jgi:ribonuclease HII
MPLPDHSIESSVKGIVAGIDEAGRGPWAGPVVAASAIIFPDKLPAGINDSKKLSHSKREQLFDAIMACAITGVGMASVEEIDELNILEATKLAMRRSLEQLSQMPDIALVDGNRAPALPCKVKTVIGGDAKSISIAAASIIAKVTRDRIMQQLGAQYPGYGWERNAGYGTAEHQKGLAALGITPHHRRSFAPIRAIIEAKGRSAA